MSENKTQERDPIFVESLMTYAEWRANMKKYPNTCHLVKSRDIFEFKPGNMKWRWGMGAVLAPGEIHSINLALINLLRTKVLLPQYDMVRSGDGHYPGPPFTP